MDMVIYLRALLFIYGYIIQSIAVHIQLYISEHY